MMNRELHYFGIRDDSDGVLWEYEAFLGAPHGK
jgi:hypothetical protein